MSTRAFTRALVTGASSGLGDTYARTLAADGVDLVVVARSTDKLTALRDELDVDVEVITADLLDPTALQKVADRLRAAPPVDLLINNAGFGGDRPYHKADLDAELSQVGIHITAMMTLTHAALRAMRASGAGGGILNVSSIAGFQPLPGMATYAACKAYETTWSEAVRLENINAGVHVTAVCPGFVDTPMVRDAEGTSAVPDRLLLSPETVVAESLRGVAENKAVVVPGRTWKAATAVTQSLPRSATRALVRGFGKLA
ncbi:SDR family NAD(P)-dependent oxidoreductase [Euzebya tangerina]|uniref:SDR family NAD(P)-dependent oxidoreductase n=1 Tax=Euzebya tangerina TaxID=591198 RepID=UPI000E31D472|nr:SDR family oxidoreductase [Euzebya tangerina]